MTYQHIEFDRVGDVAILRLNDPKTLNALTPAMSEDILAALAEAEASGARAVVLTGAGSAFCSGANLSGAGLDFSSGSFDAGAILDRYYNPMMLALRDLKVPLITAIKGPAVGFGASLALAGDLIVAGDDAYVSVAFGKIGLVPDGGVTALLVQAVGRVRALEMMLLGDKIKAETLLNWGLINRVVAADAVEAEAIALAARLAAGPTFAFGLTRKLAWQASEQGFPAQLRAERDAQALAGRSQDFQEGVQAFFSKRPAQFQGK